MTRDSRLCASASQAGWGLNLFAMPREASQLQCGHDSDVRPQFGAIVERMRSTGLLRRRPVWVSGSPPWGEITQPGLLCFRALFRCGQVRKPLRGEAKARRKRFSSHAGCSFQKMPRPLLTYRDETGTIRCSHPSVGHRPDPVPTRVSGTSHNHPRAVRRID